MTPIFRKYTLIVPSRICISPEDIPQPHAQIKKYNKKRLKKASFFLKFSNVFVRNVKIKPQIFPIILAASGTGSIAVYVKTKKTP